MTLLLRTCLVIAVWTRCVVSIPWNEPGATPVIDADAAVQGWSLAPTKAPHADELARRQAAPNSLCGYTSGAFRGSDVCSATEICVTDGNRGALGCCTSGFNGNFNSCYIRSSCVPNTALASCGSACFADPYIAKCTNAANPVCATYLYDLGTTSVRWLQCDKVSATLTLLATAIDAPTAPSAVYLAITLPTPAAVPTSRSTSSSTSTSTSSSGSSASASQTASQSATPAPGGSSPAPVGAIVGGVIGGVAVLGAIGLAVMFIIRREKSKQTPAASNPAAPVETQYPNDKTAAATTQPFYPPPPPNYVSPQQPQADYAFPQPPGELAAIPAARPPRAELHE